MDLRKRIYFLLVAGMILGLLFPFHLTMAPARSLRIVDTRGNPISDARVRQIWEQYSLKIDGLADFKVNSRGQVALPRRSVRTSMLRLVLGGIRNFLKLKIHASYGTHESIAVLAEGYPAAWFYDGKGLEEDVVVLKKTGAAGGIRIVE